MQQSQSLEQLTGPLLQESERDDSSLSRATSQQEPEEPGVYDRAVRVPRVPGPPHVNNSIHTNKYNAFTFLPLNLGEQFKKIANFYFLVLSVLVCFPAIAPYTPFTTIAPFVFVVGLSALKDAWIDHQRKRDDVRTNSRPARVLRGNLFVDVQWKDIAVGDIVRVDEDEQVPADLVLLATQFGLDEGDAALNSAGLCFIDTAELDGETNLKIFQSLAESNPYRSCMHKLDLEVQCEGPNSKLYSFNGTIQLFTEEGPLFHDARSITAKQVLLRGQVLRNTPSIWGVVVYTGHESKIMKNNETKIEMKRSKLDHKVNQQLKLVFTMLAVVCTICAIGAALWDNDYVDSAWYLSLDSASESSFSINWLGTTDPAAVFFLSLFSFVLLFANMIPISLYVTIEFTKFFTGWLIEWDVEMYSTELDRPSKCRNANIAEEVGQVEYVMSDKTGTLTRNQMELLKCSINGNRFGEGITDIDIKLAALHGETLVMPMPTRDVAKGRCSPFRDPALSGGAWLKHSDREHLEKFMLALALCNTVIPEILSDGSMKYNAASPEDGACVKAMQELGITLLKRQTVASSNLAEDIVTLRIINEEGSAEDCEYRILQTLDFSSVRKRMSVIVKHPSGKISLICKGADNVISERIPISMRDTSMMQTSQIHANSFADAGLRTMFVAEVPLQKKIAEKWLIQYDQALKQEVLDKGEAKSEAEEQIEQGLHLLGVLAIEDKLQENVGRTLRNLREASVKTWVLTGDKLNTAIMIGLACELLMQDMQQVKILECQETEGGLTGREYSAREIIAFAEEGREKAESVHKKHPPQQIAMVVEGAALQKLGIGMDQATLEALNKEDSSQLAQLQERFIWCCKDMDAVMCCRLLPKQKADLTELVKNVLGKVTLAIGDGANDVGMILKAHIGVGITGVEGSQAVNNADFAVGEFQHLGQLMLIHGRWTYRRLAAAICYFFYKNITVTFTVLWYTIRTGCSANTLYNDVVITFYNMIFTSMPVVAYALLEQDLEKAWGLRHPELYRQGPRNELLNGKIFSLWICDGIYSSVVIFIVPWTSQGISLEGHDISREMTSILMYTIVLLVVTFRLAIQTQYFTWINFATYMGSLALWYLFVVIECSIPNGLLTDGTLYWAIYNLSDLPFFWLSLILTPVLALLPAFTYKMVIMMYYPSLTHQVQQEWLAMKRARKEDENERALNLTNDERLQRRESWTSGVAGAVISEEVNPIKALAGEVTLLRDSRKGRRAAFDVA